MEEDNKNNSGLGEESYVTNEIAKHFNWGAFGFTWIWGIGNNTGIVIGIGLVLFAVWLLSHSILISLISLPVQIWFGIKGNTWAWQNKKWESIEKFHKCQRKWATITTVFISLIITGYLLVILSIGMAAIYLSGNAGTADKEPASITKIINIEKPRFNREKLPPQSYEEWQKKYDPNYVPENKLKLPSPKPRAKKVPQTYEEWLKKNPENK